MSRDDSKKPQSNRDRDTDKDSTEFVGNSWFTQGPDAPDEPARADFPAEKPEAGDDQQDPGVEEGPAPAPVDRLIEPEPIEPEPIEPEPVQETPPPLGAPTDAHQDSTDSLISRLPGFESGNVFPARTSLDGGVLDPNEDVEILRSSAMDTETSWNFDSAEADELEEAPLDENPNDSPEIRQVRKLASSLAKAVKATRLYPMDNPINRKFARELVTQFDETFSMLSEIRLTIGKTKFFFRGQEVLDQPGREDSVPGRFFWDGIREITFRDGLRPQEIIDFLGLCRRNHETADDGEDDLVTLFWEQQFEHITYINVDDILDLDNPDDPVPEEFGTAYMNFVDMEMHNLEDDDENPLGLASELAREIQKKMMEEETDLFSVAGGERDKLLAEFALEDSNKILEDILYILQETMFLDTNEVSFRETVAVITGAMSGLLTDGRLVVAGGLLRILNDMMEQKPDMTPAMHQSLEEALAIGFEEKSCAALVEHLNTNLPDVVAALDDFLGLLPESATGALCQVLSEVTHPAARKRMVEALSRRARAGVDYFIPYLKDPRPEMVRDVALILGETKSDKAIRPLRELMRHPDVNVRCVALEGLCRLGPAKAGDVLMNALQDRNQNVRLTAVKSLGEAGRVAVPALMQIIADRDFKERDLAEKKAFFRALATAGGEQALPVFKEFISQKSLFKRQQVEELRACACEALGWVGGRHAHELLEELAMDKSKMVRLAANAAIHRLEQLSQNSEQSSQDSDSGDGRRVA